MQEEIEEEVEFCPAKDSLEDEYLDFGQEIDANEVSETDEPLKLSWFKRTFPYKKYKEGFPLATEKAHMIHRRPLWLPKFGLDTAYFKHASYFSEIVSSEQLNRQKLIDAMYKPKNGEYKFSKTDIIQKQFLSKYLCGVHSCKFSPDGKFLILGFGNGSMEVFDLRKKQRESLFIKGQPRKITNIRFKKQSHIAFASSFTGRVYMIKKSSKGWKCYTLLKEFQNEINGMDMSPNGFYLATAGKDACIRIYDVNHKKLIQAFPRAGIKLLGMNESITDEISEEGHYRRICAIRFNRLDENVFATGGWDNIVKIWDLRSGARPVRCIQGPHICGDAIDIMDNNLLSGQWTCNDSLQLWDMGTSKLIKNISPMNRPICYSGEFINSVKFIHSLDSSPINLPSSRGDLIIAAGSGTKALEIISIKENVVLHAAEEANAVVALDNHREFISYGSVNNVYSIISFYPFAGKLSLTKKLLEENKPPTTTNQETGRTEKWIPVGINKSYLKWLKKLKELRDSDSSHPTVKEGFINEFIKEVKEQKEGELPAKIDVREKLKRFILTLNSTSDESSTSDIDSLSNGQND